MNMLFNYIKGKQEVRRYATWTKFRIYPKDENTI
jgi:hypothetical protein